MKPCGCKKAVKLEGQMSSFDWLKFSPPRSWPDSRRFVGFQSCRQLTAIRRRTSQQLTTRKQVIRPRASFVPSLLAATRHIISTLSATPPRRPPKGKHHSKGSLHKESSFPTRSSNTRTMSPTHASATSSGGGGLVAAGSSLRVQHHHHHDDQQQQGSPFDVNSRDPSSAHTHNGTGIPQTHKKECGMTFCGETSTGRDEKKGRERGGERGIRSESEGVERGGEVDKTHTYCGRLAEKPLVG